MKIANFLGVAFAVVLTTLALGLIPPLQETPTQKLRMELQTIQAELQVLSRSVTAAENLIDASERNTNLLQTVVDDSRAAAQNARNLTASAARIAESSTEALGRATLLLDEIEAGAPQEPPAEPEPEPLPTPTPTPEPLPTPLPGGFEPGPDISAAPFARLMPAFPQYHVPTARECEWIIEENGAIRSTLGLSTYQLGGGDGIRQAYQASVAAGHPLPVTFGVWGSAGPVVVGGQWNPDGGRSITMRNPDGSWAGISIEFLGLDDQCEVMLGWGGQWGASDYVGAYNIGLRGAQDSFAMRANGKAGKVVLDGCWFIAAPGVRHESLLHAANWDTMVVRRLRARGEKPTDPAPLVPEHVLYFKNTGPGGLWVIECALQGANGTLIHVRPGTDEAFPVSAPKGPVVIVGNYSTGYGWEHGSTPETERGGSAISVWSSPNDPVFIYNNRITDARYGCLLLCSQGLSPYTGQDRNWYNADGYAIQRCYIAGNTFENARAQRETVAISNTQECHIWNTQWPAGSRWFVDHEFGLKNTVRKNRNGLMRMYTPPPQNVFFTWMPTTGQYRRLTEAELTAWMN